MINELLVVFHSYCLITIGIVKKRFSDSEWDEEGEPKSDCNLDSNIPSDEFRKESFRNEEISQNRIWKGVPPMSKYEYDEEVHPPSSKMPRYMQRQKSLSQNIYENG